jgi:hypothetical protein
MLGRVAPLFVIGLFGCNGSGNGADSGTFCGDLLVDDAAAHPPAGTVPVSGIVAITIAHSLSKYSGTAFIIDEARAAGASCSVELEPTQWSMLKTAPPPLVTECMPFGTVYTPRNAGTGFNYSSTTMYQAPANTGVFHVRLQYTPSILDDAGPCEGVATISVQ